MKHSIFLATRSAVSKHREHNPISSFACPRTTTYPAVHVSLPLSFHYSNYYSQRLMVLDSQRLMVRTSLLSGLVVCASAIGVGDKLPSHLTMDYGTRATLAAPHPAGA